MKIKNLFLIQLLFWGLTVQNMAQSPEIKRIDPTNWWVGMKNPPLQLLVYGKNLQDAKVSFSKAGVSLLKVEALENPNFLVLHLNIAPNTAPGTLEINLTRTAMVPTSKKRNAKMAAKELTTTFPYELKARESQKGRAQGVNSADFVYLIMPDRFANGDANNDIVPGMREVRMHRDSLRYRHGGDLLGIEQKLDYIKELGVTALWLNPVIENDQPHESYHGYGFTDHYRVDARLGGNAAYKSLVEECHKNGLKMVQDIVLNHVGDKHWLFLDQPTKDWFNQWPTFTQTTYRDEPLMDPYAAEADRKIMADGWFVPTMPDLNQRNPLVASYLTQNAIWWVEAFGIDGYRVDTYAYSDLAFEEAFFKALSDEYPQLGVFGETWVHSVPNQSFFTKNNIQHTKHQSTMAGVTDFQLQYAINGALNENFGWTEGLNRLYRVLAQDFVYQDPTKNVVFLDNHDLSRYYSVIGKNDQKYEMGLVFLLTTRGIPQLYYGTELYFEGFDIGGGITVRQDMSGGWSGDESKRGSVFTTQGRNAKENKGFNFIKKLANYRKNTPALHSGKLMQFTPTAGIYVYFRYNDDKTVMVMLNQNKEDKVIDTKRFAERMQGFNQAYNIMTEQTIGSLQSITIPAQGSLVLELRK
jgi:neopullulanase